MSAHLVLLIGVTLCAAQEPLEERNKFIFYHNHGTVTYKISDGANILRSHNFDPSKRTVLYIHGYLDNQNVESVKTVVKAYRDRGDYNILTLDWSADASSEDYLRDVIPNMRKVAEVVAKELMNMFKGGLDIKMFHLVGHSVGAQLSGQIGDEIRNKSDGAVVLKRITALDPVHLGFYGPNLWHVGKNDAEFVDIIHTDAGDYGGPSRSGHADFWPNAGVKVQPGCALETNHLCSHFRSWQLWAESVARSSALRFNAVAAENWEAFKKGKVDEFNEKIVMGNDCPTDIQGNFFLQTNTESPFARGRDGAVYNRITLDTNTHAELAEN